MAGPLAAKAGCLFFFVRFDLFDRPKLVGKPFLDDLVDKLQIGIGQFDCFAQGNFDDIEVIVVLFNPARNDLFIVLSHGFPELFADLVDRFVDLVIGEEIVV